MQVQRVTSPQILSRYKAYIPTPEGQSDEPVTQDGSITIEQFQAWQNQISITVDSGMIAKGEDRSVAIYDLKTQKAYFEQLRNF